MPVLGDTAFKKAIKLKQGHWDCVGKIPWRRKWQPTPVFLPGESHGWRSLVSYSPRGCKESDTTKRLHFTSGQALLQYDKCPHMKRRL